jgi:hypothetical protein
MASNDVPETAPANSGPAEITDSSQRDAVQTPENGQIMASSSSAPLAAADNSHESMSNANSQTLVVADSSEDPSSSAGNTVPEDSSSSPMEHPTIQSTDLSNQINRVLDDSIPEATPAGTSRALGKETEYSGPSLMITLLLTTGLRHPLQIDGKYLRKCGVNVENHDPFGMSVYTLKELIWREWRPEWETRPSSPSSIRLISFGKLLDDKAPLSDSRFNRESPNVVHMTIKPQEIVDEEDAKGSKAYHPRERDPSERTPRCRCVIL